MKIRKFTLLLFIFSVLLKGASGQLSGTYTIGGTAPNYATLQAAVTALQTGITGPVIFNIRPGTYTGKVLMGNITGTSTTNTILFKSENNDSTSVIVTDSSSVSNSNNFVFLINGTDYLTIRNITIERSGNSTYTTVLNIGGGAKHFQLRNCILNSDTVGSFIENAVIDMPLGLSTDSMTTFDNNSITGSYYGIRINGQTASAGMPLTQITNNKFTAQYLTAMKLKNLNACTITNNVISAHTNNFNFRALDFMRFSHAFDISFNKVSGIMYGEAMYLDTCTGDSLAPGLVSNNFFSTEGTGFVNGVYLNVCRNLNFYFNSINVATEGTFNSALFMYAGSSPSINIENNIILNSADGVAYSLNNSAAASIGVSDYNDIYSTGDFIGFIDTANVATLSDWQTLTSNEAHSVSDDPQFISATDLHAGSPAVNNLGVHVTGVSNDIDGQSRSLSSPDIGADEFTPLNNNLQIVGFVSPEQNVCGDSATIFGVVIRNLGTAAQNNFPVHVDITGDFTQNISENFTASIITNTFDTLYFTQPLNTYSGGAVNVTAYLSLAGDQYRANDTIRATYTFGTHPVAPVVTNPQQQCDNNPRITVPVDSNIVLFWYADANATEPLYVGNVFTPTLSSDTTFYAEAHTGSGSLGGLRITEIEPSGGGDYIEIQNLSGGPFNATGYKVYASDDYTDINLVNSISWDLGQFARDEVQYRSDDFSDPYYWGNNFNWEPFLGGWAMIVNPQGAIVDFVAWDWDSTSIQSLNVVLNGVNVTVGSQWSGPGFSSCNFPFNGQRFGTSDNNSAVDFECDTASMDVANVHLALAGLCGSERVAVDVVLIAGLTPVNLGNDTIVSGAISLTLDAGAGYSSYMWSNGDTTQTTQVNSAGTYIVTVTGGSNGCTYSDTIVVSSTVAVTPLMNANEFSFYPNPATDRLVLTTSDKQLVPSVIRITDLQGRETKIDVVKNDSNEYVINTSSLNAGIYFLQLISGERMGVKRFVVLR